MKNAIKAARNPTVNLGIHALMTFCMSTIIGTGFLIKYTLIPEQERWTVYGENIELYFLEMSRHQWGMLHLILGFILLIMLGVHLILHWNIITNVYNKIIKEPITKKVLALVFILLCALMIIIAL